MTARPEPDFDDLPPLDGDDAAETPTDPGFEVDPAALGVVDFDDTEAGDLGDGVARDLDAIPDVSGDDGDATDLDIGALDGVSDTVPPTGDGAGLEDGDGPASTTSPGFDLVDLSVAAADEDDAEGPTGVLVHESETSLPDLDADDDGGEAEASAFFERALFGGRVAEPPLADRPWTVGPKVPLERARAVAAQRAAESPAPAALDVAAQALGEVEAVAEVGEGGRGPWGFVVAVPGAGRRLVLAGAAGRALEVVAELPPGATGEVHALVWRATDAVLWVVGDLAAVPLCVAGKPIDEARLGVLLTAP